MLLLNFFFSLFLNFSFIDSLDLKPVKGAVVYFKKLKKTLFSDENGKIRAEISFPETLIVSHISYKKKIYVVKDPSDTIIYLSPIEYLLKEEVIRAKKYSFKNEFTLGKYTISEDVLKLTLKGREEDVFFSLLSFPEADVQTDYSARFSVMGGSPGENLSYIDEIKIRSPFHLGEIFSFFDPSIIKSFEFYPAIIPPEYNDAVSSITVMEMEGEKKNEIKTGGVSSKFYTGLKEKNFEFYNLARIGYIGQVLKLFKYKKFNYSLIEETGKFIYRGENFIFPFTWVYSKDSYLTEDNVSELNKRDFGFSLGLKRFSKSALFSTFLSSSNFYLSKFSPYPFSYSFKNEIQNFSLKAEFSLFKNNITHKGGIKFEFEKYYIFLFTLSWGRYIKSELFKLIPYYSLKLKYKKFLIQGGVNFQFNMIPSENGYLPLIKPYEIPLYNPPSYGFYITPYNFNREMIEILGIPVEKDKRKEFVLNSEFILKYFLLDFLSFETGVAYLHQNAVLILPFEDNYRLSNYWFSNFADWEPINSLNIIGGFHIFTEQFEAKFYPYCRYFPNVLISSLNLDPTDLSKSIFKSKKGISYGGMLNLLLFISPVWNLNFSIKSGKSYFFTKKDTILSPWNSEKSIKADFLYNLTKNLTLRLSYQWNDGFYYFPPIGYYKEYSWNPLEDNFKRIKEIFIYDESYQKKFPFYSRFDLSFIYRFKIRFFKESEFEINIYNLFNRKNVYFYYYTFENDEIKKNTSYMMPFFISFNFKFTY